MASPRYTLNITEEDLKPEEAPELTAAEKRANWLHYNKWYILFGLFMLTLVIWFIHDVTTNKMPDYQFAIVTPRNISGNALNAMEESFSTVLEDVNGDGEVIVAVVHYQLHYAENFDRLDLSNQIYTDEQMADEQRIATDFSVSESIIFITDCFPGLQSQVPIFGFLDDPYAYPSEEQLHDYELMTTTWSDSELLTGLEFTEDVLDEDTDEVTPIQDFFADFQICMRTLFDHTDRDLTNRFGSCVRFMRHIRGLD